MRKSMKRIIQSINQGTNLKAGIQILKNRTETDNINQTFKNLYSISYYRPTILGNAFPKKMDSFSYSSSVYPSYDFQKELIWASNIISKFTIQINKFLELRTQFFREMFLSNYIEAELILNLIEYEFGISFWLIENRIALIQIAEGLESQKEFTHNIVENDDVNMTIRLVTRYYSIKAEKNVSPQKYNKEIKAVYNELDELNSSNPYFDYLKFKLNISDVDEFDYRFILQTENELSIIDRYITFNEVLLNMKAKDNLNLDDQTISQISDNILSINDEDLKNFWILEYGNVTHEFFNNKKNLIDIFDAYTHGEYELVIELAEHILLESPHKIELYEIYVKSLMNVNDKEIGFKGTLLQDVLENLKKIYSNESLTEENLMNLIKTCYMFSKDSWTKKLRSVALISYYGLNQSKISEFVVMGSSISSFIKPTLLKIIYKDKYQEIVRSYLDIEGKSQTINLQQAYINKDMMAINNMDIPLNRKNKYLADLHYEHKNFESAIILYESIMEEDLVFNKLEVISRIVKSFINLEEVEKAISLVVNNYFESKNIIHKIDLIEIIEKISEQNLACENINIPIIYNLYNSYISNDKEGSRNDSYEDFLDSWDITYPSELNYKKFNNKAKVIYFLRYICVPNVMAASITFESQSEVESERLAICQKLSELDPNNIKVYSEEIKTITQKQMIRKGIREIESSKIYVDVEGIKTSLEKNLKENFLRFESFGFDNINNAKPNYILIDKDINLMLPGDEKWNLFSNMVIDIRDGFVSSKEYGLDGYLSVGIRHGTLSGQLRGKVESQKLITQLDSVEQKYHENTYWVEKMAITDEDISKYLVDSLNDFSKSIDNLINKLKNELIQINIDYSKNENALFNYVISTDDLEYLYTLLKEDTIYTDFVDIIIDYLWKRTDDNLHAINEYLEKTFKIELNLCFEKLQVDIDNLKGKANITDLNNVIIRVKTEMQYEVDKISNWFSRRDTSERSDYEVNLPIEIGLEMANNIYKNSHGYELVKKDIEEIYLKGKTFRSLVDVAFIIFENIFKHSGIVGKQKIELRCFVQNGKLIFNCINKVAKKLNIERLNIEMNEKKAKLQQEKVLEMVNKEGGSGFYKIFKIISVDLKCDITMDFLFLEDHRFSLTLEIETEELFK
ncbi:hypothetical protein PNF31_26455 [Priestia megaterium]|uniref:hypothetical protein n=1 Tax=Priestia megaterium TaxID=1404 RepID=UPI00234FB059|nr:hypothetical protein [Priestia megaterium]MDC7724270.1 hypothetical protein [Priestia megaterium]